MPYLKINQDDSKLPFEELDLPADSMSWLDACHNAIGCTSIETVPTVFRGIILVIDEEGKLWDGWQNRINRVASILYGSDWDPIVGDAILARVAGEDLGPLTSDDIDRLKLHFGDFCIASQKI